MSKFKFADLFAGIGGFHLALKSIGGECVFVSEANKFARQTYRANFGTEEINEDIRELDTERMPDFDVLCAGFPCQPFSVIGQRLGFEDMRGTLFYEIARIAKAKRPKVLLLENVKHFVHHDKGRTLRIALEALEELGYKVTYKVLNARDFGLPQSRNRVFIVAWLPGMNDPLQFTWPEGDDSNTPLVAELLEDLQDDSHTLSDRAWEGKQRRRRTWGSTSFAYSLIYPDTPYSKTLLAKYQGNTSPLVWQGEDKNPRWLTTREIARLQGFPDEFILPCSKTQTYKQLGNAVPVPVVKALGEAIVEQFFSDKDCI